MITEQLRQAIAGAPRAQLDNLNAAIWKAFHGGHISEETADELSSLLALRRQPTPQTPPKALRKAVGSRPRSADSLERRRRCAASGRLPPALAAQFTLAEQAVLAVVAQEKGKRGDCRLAIGHIAALAGVGETTVRNALRQARLLGLLSIEERRLSRWRNETNIVRIVSHEWSSWLRLRGGGCKSPKGTNTFSLSEGREERPARSFRTPSGDEWRRERRLAKRG